MHVVFLSSAFPVREGEGIDWVLVRRARELARHADVLAVVPTPWAPRRLAGGRARWARYAGTPRTALLDGVPVRYPRYLQVPGAGASAGFAMAAGIAPLLRGLRRAGRCDVIFAQAVLPDGLAAAVAGRLLGVPSTCLGRGTDVHGLRRASHLERRLAAWTVRQSAGVGVVAEELGGLLRELAAPVPATLLVNGIDFDRFAPAARAPARAALGLPSRGRLVLYVGRLAPGKGLPTLLDATECLLAGVPDARLALVGTGPLAATLRARAARPPLAGRVLLPGEVPHEDVPRWLAAADVLALPSEGEGCPTVVCEALACGRPVVSTPVGDAGWLVGDGGGRIVPVGDAAALARALAAVLGARWQPEALRARVADMTWARNGQDTLRFLRRAVAA